MWRWSGTSVGIDPSANTVKLDSTIPVAVTSADDPGRSAFQSGADFALVDGSYSGGGSFIVPDGKRLVIRFFSIDALLGTGQKPGPVLVSTDLNGRVLNSWFSMALTTGDEYEGS